MFKLFSNKVTEYSQYMIDGSRFGVFFQSGTYHYSLKELAVSGGIVAMTAVSSLLGLYFNDEEKTGYSDTTLTIAAGTLGFTIAIFPYLVKRCSLNNECLTLLTQIENRLKRLSLPAEIGEQISETVINITKKQVIVHGAIQATQTLGMQVRLLTEVRDILMQNRENVLSYWIQAWKDREYSRP